MLQRPGGARLTQETVARVRRPADRAGEQLQRDEAADDRIVGLPHGAHRAFPDELVQLEFPDSPELGLCHPHAVLRSEEHTSELQSLAYLVCRLLLEKKKKV